MNETGELALLSHFRFELLSPFRVSIAPDGLHVQNGGLCARGMGGIQESYPEKEWVLVGRGT